MSYGFIIGLTFGVGLTNMLIGHFLRGMPWTDSILFGMLAGAIAAVLATGWYWISK